MPAGKLREAEVKIKVPPKDPARPTAKEIKAKVPGLKKEDPDEDAEDAPPKTAFQWCLLFCGLIIVLIGIVGPIYAFTIVSCTSTASCRIVGLLGVSGAYCAEGAGEESQYLMHGEQCTVVCQPGLVPSAPVLQCDDGVTIGAEDFKCGLPEVKAARGNLLGGLITGAITGGELQTACRRATNLKCSGTEGGTAILMQMEGIDEPKCQELMDECRETNGEFEWMMFQVSPDTTTLPPLEAAKAEFGNTDPPKGTCTLGCWIERTAVMEAPTVAPDVPSLMFLEMQGVAPIGSELCGGPLSNEVPICVNVNGSCNSADNGDYYRDLRCGGNHPQWVMDPAQGSRRIRYDGRPTFSQGGKWILEGEIQSELNTYGDFSARQNTFRKIPTFGVYGWSQRCVNKVDTWTTELSYKDVALRLLPCTCTAWNDCSGNGITTGGKQTAPNCGCKCNAGWTGKHCDQALCRAPQIFQGKAQACKEGEWIYAGSICTPDCEEGYEPTQESIKCLDDASAFSPPIFYCMAKRENPDLAALAAAQYVGVTKAPRPCQEIDCSFRGKPTGEKRADGSCVCECIPNYVGLNCRTYSGSCPAPMEVLNAKSKTCYEGSLVETTCTPQCEEGYWPVPEVLHCTHGSNRLTPETFKCYGGPPTADAWCTTMQNLSIGMSTCVAVGLLVLCIYKTPILKRKTGAYVIGTTMLVDLDQDEDGSQHHVVRSENLDHKSHLPPRLKDSSIYGPLQSGTDHISATHSDEYNEAKRILAQQSYRKDNTLAIDDAHHHHHDAMHPEITMHAVADKQSDHLALVEADAESSYVDSEASLGTAGMEYGVHLAIELPGSIPPAEPQEVHMGWHLQYHALDEECQRKRYEESHDAAAANVSLEQKAAIERQWAIDKAIEDTVESRSDCEDALQDALAAGDGEALRVALDETKVVLAKLAGAPASITNMLVRLSKIGEGRYEQYYEREDKKKAHRAWLERVKSGRAADWHMSVEEFWKYVDAGNLNAVHSGLKAKLPVLLRSTDGKRFTILHAALRPACTEAVEAVAAAAFAREAVKGRAAAEEARIAAEAAAVAKIVAEEAEARAKAEAEARAKTEGGAEAGAGIDHAAEEAAKSAYEKEFFSRAEEDEGPSIFEEDAVPEASASPVEKIDYSMVPTPEETEEIRLATERSRVGIIKALLEARASPNTACGSEETPLDLAVREGGPGSENLPIMKTLRELGFLTSSESAAEIIAEAVRKREEGSGSRLHGHTPKAKAKPPNPRG